jgi:hypothetical protein
MISFCKICPILLTADSTSGERPVPASNEAASMPITTSLLGNLPREAERYIAWFTLKR